jgi:type II secretory pathway component GspD/PulD (secretin)
MLSGHAAQQYDSTKELRVRGIRSIGLTLLLCLLALPVRAADVVRVYKVQHRTAEELLPLVETAMAGEGSVEADGGSNTLVLAGSSEGVAAALRLLSRADRPLRTVVLRYESRRLRELEGEGIRVLWSGEAGPVRVGNLALPGEGNGIGILGADKAGARESDLGGEVRILEGRSASIMTGQSVPLTTRRVQEGASGPTVTRATTFVSAESGFEAQPRILANGLIQLELRAIDSQLRPGARLASSTSVATVVLEPGKTLAIAGLTQDAEMRSASFASGAGSSQREDERLLLLTAIVE